MIIFAVRHIHRNMHRYMHRHMHRHMRYTLSVLGMVLFCVMIFMSPTVAYEKKPIVVDPGGKFQEGSQLGALEETGNCIAGENPIPGDPTGGCGGLTFIHGGPVDIAAQIINLLLGLLGVLSLFLMVYAGWTWMLARGNQEKVTKAKDIITGTVIGLFMILASYAFLQTIFRNIADISGAGIF